MLMLSKSPIQKERFEPTEFFWLRGKWAHNKRVL